MLITITLKEQQDSGIWIHRLSRRSALHTAALTLSCALISNCQEIWIQVMIGFRAIFTVQLLCSSHLYCLHYELAICAIINSL